MKHVLIIGAGFAGLAAASRLARARGKVHVTLMDSRPAHQFLPLLPDIVGGRVAARHCLYPLSTAARRWGFRILQDTVTAVNTDTCTVTTTRRPVTCDRLLLCPGSQTNFYGRDDLRRGALTLNSVEDAQRLRGVTRDAANACFVIAGGGYTGVEAATNLWLALSRRHLRRRIVIVDTADSLCAGIPPVSQGYVTETVRSLGIELRLSTTVAERDGRTVTLSTGERFEGVPLVWTAGVRTPDFVEALDHAKTRQGRLLVDRFLRITPEVFVAGDAAGVTHHGGTLRMGVQFAREQGTHAARNILNSLSDRDLVPFVPFDPGYVVPMANLTACGLALGLPVRGLPGSLLHYLMCFVRSYGMTNRLGLLAKLFSTLR